MTYSLENLVFRAVGAAVNTAARAAKTVLTVMYPPDIGHIWDDSPREGVEAALADPHPVGVDDAAGVVPPTPAASLTSPAAGGEGDRDPFPVVDDALAGNRDTKATAAGGLNLPWEVIDLRDPPYDRVIGLPWGIADRWGVIIGRFDTEDQAYAVVEAISANTLAGGPLLW